jgi:hypothetical protein
MQPHRNPEFAVSSAHSPISCTVTEILSPTFRSTRSGASFLGYERHPAFD